MKVRGKKIFRFLDHYLGSCLLTVIGSFQKRYLLDKPMFDFSRASIVVLKTGAIGDAILVGAVLDAVKQEYPEMKITFICTLSNYDAVKGIGSVDNIIKLDLLKPWEVWQKIDHTSIYDFLIDFAPWTKINALIASKIRARWKIGFRTARMHRHYIYDQTSNHSNEKHEIINYIDLMKLIDLNISNHKPVFKIDVNLNESRLVEYLLKNNNIVFHPFAGGSLRFLKEWPDSRWIELGCILKNDGKHVIVSGGENERLRAEAIAKQIGENAISLAGKLNLNQLAYILKRSDILITVDTGIMHLGAAVGTSVISLHGPTSPKRWGAIGDNVFPLVTNFPCSPCINLGFDSACRRGGCMEDIGVEQVYRTILKILQPKK